MSTWVRDNSTAPVFRQALFRRLQDTSACGNAKGCELGGHFLARIFQTLGGRQRDAIHREGGRALCEDPVGFPSLST